MSLCLCSCMCLCVSDVDECSDHLDSCAFRCHNVPGSFRCLCPKGFQLAADARHCEGDWQCDVTHRQCTVHTVQLCVLSVFIVQSSMSVCVCVCKTWMNVVRRRQTTVVTRVRTLSAHLSVCMSCVSVCVCVCVCLYVSMSLCMCLCLSVGKTWTAHLSVCMCVSVCVCVCVCGCLYVKCLYVCVCVSVCIRRGRMSFVVIKQLSLCM